MSFSRSLSSLLTATGICISVTTPFNVAAFISSSPKMFVRPLVINQSPKSTKLHQVYLEDDLVSVDIDGSPKLFVVRSDSTVSPLCTHEDDNLTDLYVDPREQDNLEIDDKAVLKCYGEGWYSQRVVPSLGGGPGYGASADDVWSVEEEVIEIMEKDGIEIPVLDLGIAHGEKARGGAI